ncbi:CBS domain-containing protein [Streptomyces sp. NPDC047000]|uniref:CBS domain-containing protein n=1 Tax=Streptomyces sp. NPDC047000 TaxID=3155474 RepID=UPI003405BCD0
MYGTAHLVGDVMTRTVVALGGGAAFKDIVRAMRQFQVSVLPVVDDQYRVLGVVSEADLLSKEELRDDGPDRGLLPARLRLADLAKAGARTAGELMTVPPVTVRPDETLSRAARTMAHRQVNCLPVVDGEGVLKGVVSRSDLLKVFLREDLDIAGEIRREVVARLFPSPLEPVRVTVHDGVVGLTGRVPDASLVPVAVRLVRAVEGVVDVDCALTGPRRRVDLDADLPDTGTAAEPEPERPEGPEQPEQPEQ